MRSSHFYEWVVSNQGNCMCSLSQKWCVCVSVGYAGWFAILFCRVDWWKLIYIAYNYFKLCLIIIVYHIQLSNDTVIIINTDCLWRIHFEHHEYFLSRVSKATCKAAIMLSSEEYPPIVRCPMALAIAFTHQGVLLTFDVYRPYTCDPEHCSPGKNWFNMSIDICWSKKIPLMWYSDSYPWFLIVNLPFVKVRHHFTTQKI